MARAETRFRLSAKRTIHLNRRGRQFSRLLVVEMCASAVVMDKSCVRGSGKGTGYPFHSPVSPSLPLPCVTVCRQISTRLYCSYLLSYPDSLIHLGRCAVLSARRRSCCFAYNALLREVSYSRIKCEGL